jgi:hypothetical protein
MPHEQLREQLWRLSVGERCAMLTISIVESDCGDPLRVALRMAHATGKLCELLSDADRFRVSDKLRNLADELEQRALLQKV